MSPLSDQDSASSQALAGDWQQYIAFELDGQFFGIEITSVREIRQWSPATELPNQPHYGRGVLDIRGEVVPVYDLRARFGGPVVDVTESHVVLIVSIDDRSLGTVIDAVSDIIDVKTADLRPVPEGARETEHGTVTSLANHNDRMIALLDLPALFGTQNMANGPAARRSESVNPEAIDLVQGSFRKVSADADRAAGTFYHRLFEIAPEIRAMFPDNLADQKKKLITTLALAINSLRNIDTVLPALRELGVKHRGYGVKDEHYALVGEALLYTLGQALGSEWTPDVKAA
jgi:purine-binding chemotaxis protein CheW